MTEVHHTHTHDEAEPHDHHHDHDHEHGHHHEHQSSWWARIAEALHIPGFSHSHERPALNDSLYANELGIRTVKIAFVVLAATTMLQIGIYLASHSVALLADTIHNLSDALNSLPLWIAFVLIRRPATKRYTYG